MRKKHDEQHRLGDRKSQVPAERAQVAAQLSRRYCAE